MYENFIPELWSKELMVERPRETVFAKLCYKGILLDKIKNVGDRVRITGIGRPTIQTYTKGQTLTTEFLSDNTQEIPVDQYSYFDFAIDDIDNKQATGEIETAQLTEARRGLAEALDEYIAKFYADAGTSVTETEVTSSNVISKISSAYTKLVKNNIPTNEEVNLVVSPEIAEKIVLADIIFNTDNSKQIMGFMGQLKRFMNCTVYVSNSVYSNEGVDYCMMFTNKAIALVEQILKVEKARPSGGFYDIVKALHVYGGKVIKPKELVALNLTATEETGF